MLNAILGVQRNKINKLSNLGSSNNQKIVTARQTQVAVNHKFSINFSSNQSENFSAKSTSEKATKNIAAENFFKVTKKDTCIPGYYFTYKSQLEYLLTIAKSKYQVGIISEEDYDLIVKCCDCQEFVFRSNAVELTKLSVRILSYLAENKVFLSKKTIKSLIKELKNQNPQTLPDVMHALCCAINNGQNLSQMLSAEENTLFFESIRKLFCDADCLLNLSTVVLGFFILAKQGVKLEVAELDFLRKTLSYMDDSKFESHFLLPLKKVCYFPEDRYGNTWKITFNLLGNLEEIAKSKKLLSKKEITLLVRQWEKNSDLDKKLKIINTLRYVFLNGQTIFDEPKKLITILTEALREEDRVIKSYAIVLAGYLTTLYSKNDQNPYGEVVSVLSEVLDEQRVIILKTINLYLDAHVNDNDLEKSTSVWKAILDEIKLKSAPFSEVNSKASFTLARLNGELDNLELLILDLNYCVEVTYYLAEKSAQEFIDAGKTLEYLGVIIAENQYPLQAKLNAAIALNNAAQFKKLLPDNSLIALIDYACESDDVTFCNSAWSAVGACANKDCEIILNSKCLKGLHTALFNPVTALNAAFALKNILEILPGVDFKEVFLSIFLTLNAVLIDVNNQYDQDTKYNVLLIFLQAAKKGFLLPVVIIDQLGDFIASPSVSDVEKLIVLDAVNFLLKSHVDIKLNDNFLLQLIKLLASEDIKIRNNAGYILWFYFEKNSGEVSKEVFVQLTTLLTNVSSCFLVLEIFGTLIRKNIEEKLNLKFINLISPVLDEITKFLKVENEELRIMAVQILHKAIKCCEVNENTLKLLQLALHDENKIVSSRAISVLKILMHDKHRRIILSLESCENLVNLIDSKELDFKTHKNIVSLLLAAAEDGQSFTPDVIVSLAEKLNGNNVELKNSILKILRYQFDLSVDVTLSKRLAFKQVIVFLEEFFSEEALVEDIALVLMAASKNGYAISPVMIERLADFLLDSPEENRRKYAFEIISNVKNNKLSEKVNKIQSLEANNFVLLSEETSVEEKIKAIKYLCDAAKAQQYLTRNNFIAFEAIINSKKTYLYAKVLEAIYFSVKNGQQLSSKMLNTLAAFVKDKSLKKSGAYAFRVLVLSALDGYFLPDSIFAILENVLPVNLKTNAGLKFLQAVEVGVKRNGKLQTKALSKIFNYLNHANLEVNLCAARIILSLIKNQQCKADIMEDLLEKLESLDGQAAAKLVKYLCNSIKGLMEKFKEKYTDVVLDKIKNNLAKFEPLYLKSTSVVYRPLTEIKEEDLIELVVSIERVCRNGKSNAIFMSANFIGQFKNIIFQLLQSGWSFEKISNFLNGLQSRGQSQVQLEDILMAFEIAHQYGLQEDNFYKYDFLNFDKKTLLELHQQAVNKCFTEKNIEKDLSVLLEEISNNENNKQNIFVKNYVSSGKLKQLFEQIEYFYEDAKQFPSQYEAECLIKEWTIQDIQAWSNQIKNLPDSPEKLAEIFAVMNRACYLQWGHTLRRNQIIAVLALLMANPGQGRLAQLATGQGKSIIVAVLAAIKALQNKTVDVITSSSILAKHDAKLFKPFYEIFNLKVASNEDKGEEAGLKKCYSKDINIVYGDLDNFEFDLLRDEYSLLGTRGGREFGEAIVDEVDNLLVDGNSKIAMLASSMPGMKQLQVLMVAIWQELQKIESQLIEDKGQLFYHIAKEEPENKEKLFKISGSRIGFIAEMLEEKILSLLLSKDSLIDFPGHLKQFVATQLPKWIVNALDAHYFYHEDHHYKIGLDSAGIKAILPLDFANTGQTQMGTSWGDGLQQFLQIKHGLKFTTESLTTNFMSNMAFMRRYENRISGLTGTLGSPETRNLLAEIYHVDCIDLPSYKTERLHTLPGILVDSEEAWIDKIAKNAIQEAKLGRAVLVLCETIERAEKIQKRISELKTSVQLKSYIESDGKSDFSFFNQELDSNTIVVSTNLAARGADVKLSQAVIDKGGLHVCFTFLASSSRGDRQGFGRSGRAGNPGTGQLILNYEHVLEKINWEKINAVDPENLTVEEIIKLRDEQVEAALKDFQINELPKLKIKDDLFKKFCKLLKKLKELDQKTNEMPDADYYCQCKRQAVEERWGLWLKQSETLQSHDEIFAEFKTFKKAVLQDYEANVVVKNPHYYIRYANSLIKYAATFLGRASNCVYWNSSIGLYKTAIENYDKAIALDPVYAYLAYYYKAYALIKLNEEGAKQAAKECLLAAKQSLAEKINLQLMAILQTLPKQIPNKELENQISYEIQALESLLENIETAINVIDRSMKPLEIIAQSNTASHLSAADAKAHINESEDEKFSLNIRNFKTHKDVVTIYEAERLLAVMEKNSTVSVIFSSQELNKYQRGQQIWCELLPINAKPTEKDQEPNESENKANPEEPIGFEEWFSSKLSTITSTASEFFENAQAAFNNKIIKPALLWWDDYEIAKQIPVSIGINALKFVDAKNLLEKLKTVCDENLTLKIKFSDSQKGFVSATEVLTINELCLMLESSEHENSELAFIFTECSQEEANKILTVASDHNMTLAFENLQQSDAKKLLPFTKNYQEEAVFKFDDLDKQQALHLLQALPENPELNVGFQPLEKFLPKTSFALSEIAEYQSNGLQDFFSLSEQKPMPWRSILLLSAAGLTQVAIGLTLAALTAGVLANVGMTLTVEGLCDAMRALNVFRSGEFDLSSYLIQKAASLTWSISTLGLSSLTLTNKAVSTTKKLSFSLAEVVDQATVSVIVSAKSAALNVGQRVVSESAKILMREGVSYGLGMAASHAVENIEKTCLQEMNKVLQILVNKKVFKQKLQRLFAIDECSGNDKYQHALKAVIQSKVDKLQNKSGLGLGKGQIFVGGYKLLTALEDFEVGFAEALRDIQLPNFEEILYIKLKRYFTLKEVSQICNLLIKHGILNEEMNGINLQPIWKDKQSQCSYQNFDKNNFNYDLLNLEQFERHKAEIISVCKEFYLSLQEGHSKEKNAVIKTTANALTKFIVKTTQSMTDNFKEGLASAVGSLADLGVRKVFEEIASHGSGGNVHSHSNTHSDSQTQSRGTTVIVTSPNNVHGHSTVNSDVQTEASNVDSQTQSRNTIVVVIPNESSEASRNVHNHPSENTDSQTDLDNTSESTATSETIKKSNRNLRGNYHIRRFEKYSGVHVSVRKNHSPHFSPVSEVIQTEVLAFSFSAITNTAIAQYQKSLFQEYQERIEIFVKKFQAYAEKKSVLDDELITEARKIIKLLLGMILLEVRLSKILSDLSLGKESFNQEEVINEIEEVFKNCVSKDDQAYKMAKKYFSGLGYDCKKTKILFSELKEMFFKFNQLFKEESVMPKGSNNVISKIVGDINFGDVVGQVMQSINDKNYSQVGLLLRDGKLGPSAGLAGLVIEGMFDAQKVSAEAHSRMQLALTEIMKQVVTDHQTFRMKVLEMDEKRIALVKSIAESETMKMVITSYNEAVKTKDKDQIADARYALDLMRETTKDLIKLAEIICPGDPKFVVECQKQSSALVDNLRQTLEILCKEQDGVVKELFSTGKQIIFKMIDASKEEKALVAEEPEQLIQEEGQKVLEKQSAWKKDYEKANVDYLRGKTSFGKAIESEDESKQKVHYKSAANFFASAQKKYQSVKNVHDDAEVIAKAEKRLAKLGDDGKYSISDIKVLLTP